MDSNVAEGLGEDRLLTAAVETLPAHIAILDTDGSIRATNRAWREFGEANGIQTSPDTTGVNYLSVTDDADDIHANLAAAGLRAILDGEREQFELEYPCHSPDERRWFVLRAAPFVQNGERYVSVVHTDITDRKETESRLRATSEMLQFVQETMASSQPLEDKMEQLLDFGREYLGIEQGIFTHIHDGIQEIRVAVGPNEQIQSGESGPVEESYCRHTIDADTPNPLIVEHASEEGWMGDPAFERFGLDCYVGATILVDGEPYGTICFADREPADGSLTEPQQTFVGLLTEWASYELEQRKRERQYRRLTERISDAYYAFDSDWTITYWNDAIADRLGIPAEEIVGETLWERFPELTDTVYGKTLRDAMATQERQSCEFHYEPADYWVEITAYPDDEGISVISTDITERKERERELELAETVFQNTQDAIFLIEVTDESEFRIKRVNEQYEELTGLSNDALRGKMLREAVGDELAAEIDTKYRDCVERREPLEYVEKFPISDAPTYWHTKIAPVVDDDTVVELVGATRDITDRKERIEKLQQLKQNITDVVWMTDPEKDSLDFVSDSYEDVWGRSVETIRTDPMTFLDAIHPDDRNRVEAALATQRENPDEYDETYRVIQPDGKVKWVHDRSSGVYEDGTLARIVGVASDITERKKREQELEVQRDELTQLHRLNTLVREIIQALQDTNTRDGLESAVCDRLTASELYRAVWIGASDLSRSEGGTVVPRMAAGLDDDFPTEITEADDPAVRALRTGEIQVVDDVTTADSLSEAHRQATLDHDCHALAAVPLTSENTSHGVLVVYVPDGHTISDDERDILADLGEMMVLAIQRVNSQRSLAAETVVELDFRLFDADVVFGKVSALLDCELTLERMVPTGDRSSLSYHTVRGADPERVAEAVSASDVIDGCTTVREAEDGQPGLIETYISDKTRLPTTVLTDYGASVTSARAVDGDIHFSAELAPEIDVRTVIDTIRETLPDVELVSKQVVDRSVTTVPVLRESLRDTLTPKQRATLEVAYSRGYYSWPRDSTAEELADVLDISAPALHYRLRRAHQTVLQALLDSDANGR